MKTLILFSIVFFCFNFLQAKTAPTAKKAFKDQHTSIYTPKIQRIVNALDVSGFETPDSYLGMLHTACERNQCSAMEKKTIKSVGEQILNCQIKHLKSHDIENPDATALCQSKQAMMGCDTMPNKLLRRMCYTGNKYSLKTWQAKEKKFQSRMPASK